MTAIATPVGKANASPLGLVRAANPTITPNSTASLGGKTFRACGHLAKSFRARGHLAHTRRNIRRRSQVPTEQNAAVAPSLLTEPAVNRNWGLKATIAAAPSAKTGRWGKSSLAARNVAVIVTRPKNVFSRRARCTASVVPR